MPLELIALLIETTLASSAALVVVLLLRRPMRAVFGAGAAYTLWWLVPVALIAVLLPAPMRDVSQMQRLAAVRIGGSHEVISALASGWSWPQAVLMVWLAGVLTWAIVLGWRQHRFMRGLGVLERVAPHCWQANVQAGLPALVGVLRPRLIVPADFKARYDMRERALILRHERVHLRRGDLQANAVAALTACLFWFNPLMHLGMRGFRFDQELACDARVIARHPRQRRPYGTAMLKTQLDPRTLPAGCHWQAFHPMKERIAMLKRNPPRRAKRLMSFVLACGLAAVTGYSAWATQPAREAPSKDATGYSVRFVLDVDGESNPFEIHANAGEPFSFKTSSKDGRLWSGEFTIKPVDGASVVLDGHLDDNGTVVSSPKLQFYLGREAEVQVNTDDATSLVKMRVTARLLTEQDRALEKAQAAAAGNAKSLLKGDVKIRSQPDGSSSFDANSIEASYGATRLPLNTLTPPAYPEAAAKAKMEGRVVVLIDVAADGSVVAATVETSQPVGVFDAAVLKAVRGWKFNPALDHGKAVAGRVRVPVDFSMDETSSMGSNAGFDGSDYGWFTQEPGKEVASALNCDVATIEQDDKGDLARTRCGIRKPAR